MDPYHIPCIISILMSIFIPLLTSKSCQVYMEFHNMLGYGGVSLSTIPCGQEAHLVKKPGALPKACHGPCGRGCCGGFGDLGL